MTQQELDALRALSSYPEFWVLKKVAKDLKEEFTHASKIDRRQSVEGQAWGLLFVGDYIDSFLSTLEVGRPTKPTDKTYE